MPYRLRIKFPGGSPQAPISLIADKRAFTITGRRANLVPPTTIPVEDVWVNVTPTTGITSPNVNQGWWKATLIEATGDVFIHQGRESSDGNNPNSGTYYWRKATRTWEKVGGRIGDDWWKYDREGTSYENYDNCYDPDRHRVWISGGAPTTENAPHAGEMYFDCASNEFYVLSPYGTPFNGTADTWLPTTVEDQQHWRSDRIGLRALKSRIDPVVEYRNGKVYSFGGWSTTDANLWTFDPVTEARTITSLSGPKWRAEFKSEVARDRGGIHRRENYLWTIAEDCNFWVLNLNDKLLKWRLVPTNGPKPFYQTGLVCELHEEANCIVTHNGNDAVASVQGPQVDECHVLDLSNLTWRPSTQYSLGSYMPRVQLAVSHHLLYDPVDKVIREVGKSLADGFKCEIWEFTPKYTRGTLTAFPLPPAQLSPPTPFPYTNNEGSKHTNMAYCPINNSMYVSGGDMWPQGSGAEGCWRMDMNTGVWTRETGDKDDGPVVPVDAQDGMGFEWDSASNRGGTGRNKFIFWPGAYVTAGTTPTHQWARGYWTFDPITKIWEQDLRLFSTFGSSAGVYGGCWDKDTDIVYSVGNGSGSEITRRYNLTTGQDLGTLTWANATSWRSGSTSVAFYSRNKHVFLNGKVYVLGNGTSDGLKFFPMFAEYTVATNTMKLLSTPHIPRTVQHLEARPVASGDKIIWPASFGPDGLLPYGILIYHTTGDFWTIDYQIPLSGLMTANCVGQGPDEMVCFSGATEGPQQTHFWMYQPAS